MPDPLFALVLSAAVVQGAAWLGVAVGLRRVRDRLVARDLDADAPPVPPNGPAVPAIALSVVVAARDEARRLPALLAALGAQTHRAPDGTPRFEVVVVDDRSTDDTAAVLRRQAAAWDAGGGPALRVVTVPEGAPEAAGQPPKKHALAAGLAAAVHDRVALTDADCRPPPAWLATLARHATGADGLDGGALLVGYSPLARAPGALNRFARFETLQTALLAAAGVGWGVPWHGVGRNLSYPRHLPARVGGFAGASLSGDDDLLVQAAARAGTPVDYVLDAAAFVPTDAPPSWRAFLRQKRRHAGAGAHYRPGVLAALGALRLSALAVWVGAPLHALATGRPTAWGVHALVLLAQRMAWRSADDFAPDPDVTLAQPLLDGAAAVYHAVFALLGATPGPRRW